MNNQFKKISAVLAAVLMAFALTSCLSIKLDNMKDDELITAGVEQWNKGDIEQATVFWSHIKDPALNAAYTGYPAEKTAIETDVEALLALSPSPDDKYSAAFEALAKRLAAFPKELNISVEFKPQLRPATVEVVKSRIRAGKVDQAKAFIKTANDFLGESDIYDQYLKEVESLAGVQTQEKAARKLLDKARATDDFDDRIKAYETAIAAYGKVDAAASAEIKKANLPETAPLAVFQGTIRKARSTAVVEMEKTLKSRADTFNERIGEIFARTPSDDQLGNMTPEDLLKFYQSIKTDIGAAYDELTAFAAKYPKVIDKGMIAELNDERANLDTRIVQITDEIRKMQEEAARVAEEARKNKIIADEYASRGRVAIPLMIGLFNPQPGSAAESKKSRPAKMKGKINGEAEYWWGMISIDKDSKDDLVVTMSDGKEVQVYAENPKRGDATDKMKNLISMKDKIGKSWPVINAAKYLTNNRYFLQIKKNGTPAYAGEVVIYKSFISRMR